MDAQPNGSSDHHFRERFDSLLPSIRRRWPDLAQHTLEATRGSMDEVVRLIEQNTGLTPQGVREQLEELMHSAGESGRHLADSLDPLEQQLEQLLDELNTTLRPRIEQPVRQRPLLGPVVWGRRWGPSPRFHILFVLVLYLFLIQFFFNVLFILTYIIKITKTF